MSHCICRTFVTAFAALGYLVASLSIAQAQLFETKAPQALLLDVGSRTILLSKNADKQVPPASLAKLMTMEVVFHALKVGRLTMNDEFLVSENAWRTGGAPSGTSTMFAKLKSSIRLEDLIKGVIVQSANDGCIIIAEGMAGSEAAFARLMNERAREIGLKNSIFVNSTGLPADGQFVTMRDLVKLAEHLQTEYPEYSRFYQLTEFTWNGIRQRNRNPLLAMDIGATGFKTGYTEESGYAIVGAVNHSGRKLILAMSGLSTMNERREEARKVLDWGVRAFEPYILFKDGESIGSVRTYGGAHFTVPVTTKGDALILMPVGNADKMKARIIYQGPVMAPVEKGAEIATLRVFLGDKIAQELPLYAAEDVNKGPIHRRALDALAEMAAGWIPDL